MSKADIIIIIIAVVALVIIWAATEKIRVRLFTSKTKKEDSIRQLMKEVPYSKDRDKILRKLCLPLTLQDLAGKELNLQMIHYLESYRDSDFAAEAVKQASNSAALMKDVREEYFSWLLDGKKDHLEKNTFEKLFSPLTGKDFSGKTLSKKNVYCLERRLDTGFVVDVVQQAPNSTSLIKDISDDIREWRSDDYKENSGDIHCAERILKAAYRKGYSKKEIKAKDGTTLRARVSYTIGNCAYEEHVDEPGIYFKL